MKNRSGEKIKLASIDELLGVVNEESAMEIEISKIHPFKNHPFKVLDDEKMQDLVESVKINGVLTPVLLRMDENEEYEMVSGHRRMHAAQLAGLTTIPAIVRELSDDDAVIAMVDANIQREELLPSEKAFAYKMKMDAMRRTAGRPTKENPRQIVGNLESADILGQDTGESGRQIQRYIRLTNLIDPILDMVDNNQIAMNAAVEISYLGSREQAAVMQSIEKEETSPSIAQARKMRQFHQEGKLSDTVIESIMMEQKPETVKITLGEDKLKKYFPKSYSKAKMEEIILKLLDKWRRQRENEMER